LVKIPATIVAADQLAFYALAMGKGSFMALGIALGAGVGAALGNIALGIAMGALAGGILCADVIARAGRARRLR
jgi:hypothetical protein